MHKLLKTMIISVAVLSIAASAGAVERKWRTLDQEIARTKQKLERLEKMSSSEWERLNRERQARIEKWNKMTPAERKAAKAKAKKNAKAHQEAKGSGKKGQGFDPGLQRNRFKPGN